MPWEMIGYFIKSHLELGMSTVLMLDSFLIVCICTKLQLCYRLKSIEVLYVTVIQSQNLSYLYEQTYNSSLQSQNLSYLYEQTYNISLLRYYSNE